MSQNDMEIALIKYNKKTWCKSGLLGFFIGLAVIVPGISGSTVAIIFKLYDQFLYAVGNLFKNFKRCFAFLLPIGIGLIVGVLLGFLTVKQLLEWLPFAVIGLFAGLMSGAFPAVADEVKGMKWTPFRIALLCVGVCIPVAIGCFSAVSTANGTALSAETANGAVNDAFSTVLWWQVPLALVVGYAVGVTQIVPGLSASAILMAIGWFQSLVNSVSVTYWTNNPAIFFVYAGLGIGFLAGLLTFSKFLTYLFKRARNGAYSLIVGLSVGSILSMFLNGDVVAVYAEWARLGVAWADLILGIFLFAVGGFVSYLLVRYQRKKDAEKAAIAAEITMETSDENSAKIS